MTWKVGQWVEENDNVDVPLLLDYTEKPIVRDSEQRIIDYIFDRPEWNNMDAEGHRKVSLYCFPNDKTPPKNPHEEEEELFITEDDFVEAINATKSTPQSPVTPASPEKGPTNVAAAGADPAEIDPTEIIDVDNLPTLEDLLAESSQRAHKRQLSLATRSAPEGVMTRARARR